MIVNIRGTDYSHNMAAHVTAVLAGINASTLARKTLIIQLNKGTEIEKLLIGKSLNEEALVTNSFAFEDDGIDALLLRAETQRLLKEHFDACCLPVLNADNLLDIATMSKKTNFEGDFITKKSEFTSILIGADTLYDDVFIFSNGKNPEIQDMLNHIYKDNLTGKGEQRPYINYTVICIPQGLKETVAMLPEQTAINKDHPNYMYLITDYDRYSTYNSRYMKNMYEARNIAIMPYNIEFKDAYNNGTMMQFIKVNEKTHTGDINHDIIFNLREMLKTMGGGDLPEVKDMYELPEASSELPEPEITNMEEPPAVVITEKKKGFFKKKTEKIVTAAEPEEFEDDSVLEKLPIEGDDSGDLESEIQSGIEETKKHKKRKKQRRKKEKIALEEITEDDASVAVDGDENLMEITEDSDDLDLSELDLDADAEADELIDDLTLVDDISLEEDMPFSETITEDNDFVEETRLEDTEMTEDEDASDVLSSAENEGNSSEDNTDAQTENKDVPIPHMVSKEEQKPRRWRCPACENVNSSAAKFCQECGLQKPGPKWVCTKCGEKNKYGTKYCQECGEKRVS